MYDKAKYVVGEVVSDSYSMIPTLAAVVVSELVPHDALRRLFHEDSICGAGFFQVDADRKIYVYGESVSLKVKSRPEDAAFVAKAIGLWEPHN